MGDSPTYRTKAFISYSHVDKAYLEQLQKHLKFYVRESNIKVWDDTQIPPGGDWRAAIERALAEAQVAILLVSVDFLASDFVANVELPKLLAAARAGDITILPVILGYCGFRRSRLDQFQSVNDPEKPLDSLLKFEQDKIWLKVAELTRETLTAKRQEWSEKAKNLFEAEKYEEALFACEYVLQSKPDDAFALKYKGAALNYLARYGEALVALEQAIQLKPDDAFAYKYKGAALYALGQEEEALAAFEMALKFDDRSSRTFGLKGQVLFSLQRYEEAVASLEQAIQLGGSFGTAGAQKYKGAALFHLQRYEEALASLQQALEPVPGSNTLVKSSFVLMYEGASLFHLARYKEALEALDMSLRSDKAAAFALKYKGAALFHLEREVEALDALEEALRREPKDAFAFKYKGAALVTLEQENEALVVLEQALKLEPDDVSVLRYYGAALLGLRRYEEALGVVEQALQLEPGDGFALTLKSKIEKIIQYKNKLAQVEAAPAPRKAAR